MTIPSILGSMVEVTAGATPRHALRTGRVSAPVPPADPAFKAYEERCLRSWSVDVELDSGEYLIGCRLITPQGNSREGVRRLPRLPSAGPNDTIVAGDLVVVGFLNGVVEAPLVLGALNPSIHSSVSADDLELRQMTSRRVDEVQERYEHTDLSDADNPAIVAAVNRNTGLMVEHEHAGEMIINGTRLESHYLERQRGGRDLETEQVVKVDQTTTATVRESNQAGKDLKHVHAVKAPDGVSVVSYQDLQAQVLQLTQQVKDLSKLVVSSDNANRLLLQQETPKLRTTIFSDNDSRTVQLLAEDLDEKTRAGWSVGPKGELLLRRLNSAGKETKVILNDDDTLTLQTPTGPTVHLDEDTVMVTSGGSSITVSEDQGISLITKGGSMISAFDDAVVVTGPTCTINAGAVHLKTGSLLVGDSEAGAQQVPSASALQRRMLQIETAFASLVLWARSHTHPVVGTAAGVSLFPAMPTSASPKGLFNMSTDTLKTVKGV